MVLPLSLFRSRQYSLHYYTHCTQSTLTSTAPLALKLVTALHVSTAINSIRQQLSLYSTTPTQLAIPAQHSPLCHPLTHVTQSETPDVDTHTTQGAQQEQHTQQVGQRSLTILAYHPLSPQTLVPPVCSSHAARLSSLDCHSSLSAAPVMSVLMSNPPNFPDSDVLGSPYATSFSAAFPLFNDGYQFNTTPLALPSPPFSSPPHQPAAPQPRRLSSTLFRLSPTYTAESAYHYQWNEPYTTATTVSATAAASPLPVKDELLGYRVSPIESSTTPSVSITSACSSIASYLSPPSTPTPSTASPTPTPSPYLPGSSLSVRPLSGRQRSATVGSLGDRVLRKRRRQRECDIQRRQKENMGFNRLYVLLTAGSMRKQQKLIQQQLADEEEEEGEGERKMNKADILHQSAERIEQLERSLQQLTEAHSRRHSLDSAKFIHSAGCLVVLHVPSGYITDVSERYLEHTGNERSWVVGRRFFPSYQQLKANPMSLTRPCNFACYQSADRVLCKPEDGTGGRGGGTLRPTILMAQCEATVRLWNQLCDGEIDTMCAVWRSEFGNGRTMEKTVYSWITEWEQHDNGSRTPVNVMCLISTSDTVSVE